MNYFLPFWSSPVQTTDYILQITDYKQQTEKMHMSPPCKLHRWAQLGYIQNCDTGKLKNKSMSMCSMYSSQCTHFKLHSETNLSVSSIFCSFGLSVLSPWHALRHHPAPSLPFFHLFCFFIFIIKNTTKLQHLISNTPRIVKRIVKENDLNSSSLADKWVCLTWYTVISLPNPILCRNVTVRLTTCQA